VHDTIKMLIKVKQRIFVFTMIVSFIQNNSL